MSNPDDFDKVRSKRPTQSDLGEWSERAADEASSVAMRKPHAAWQAEAGAWQALADAAYACECILVRRALAFTRGEPEEDA